MSHDTIKRQQEKIDGLERVIRDQGADMARFRADLKAEQDRHTITVHKWSLERRELTDELVKVRAELEEVRKVAAENAGIANERAGVIVDLRRKYDELTGERFSDRVHVVLKWRADTAEAKLIAARKELELSEGFLREERAQNERALNELAALKTDHSIGKCVPERTVKGLRAAERMAAMVMCKILASAGTAEDLHDLVEAAKTLHDSIMWNEIDDDVAEKAKQAAEKIKKFDPDWEAAP